jgi:hypothetical protein
VSEKPLEQVMRLANLVSLPSSFGLSVLPFVFCASLATAQEIQPDTANTFRWIHPDSDPQLWEQVLKSFSDELSPDEPSEGRDKLDVYRYKYLQKVGVLNHSALVVVGRRPAKEVKKETAWDEYYSAFNFDFTTQHKSPIQRAEQMWSWKFRGLAKFGPSSVPDVTFTYLTCTECEPELVFASMYYDATKFIWRVRSWGDGKDLWWTGDDGVIVDMDVNNGGDLLSFDCVHGIVDGGRDGFKEFVVRCKQITDTDKGRAKIEDSTVLYSLIHGRFTRRRITDDSEALALTGEICRPTSTTWLCRLPGYMTATSGQNDALDQMFPQAPKTSRDIQCFRNLAPSTTMSVVAQRCGSPDELGGSGINIFIYHLDDGSIVGIGAAGTTQPIMYANHTTSTGRLSDLIVRK